MLSFLNMQFNPVVMAVELRVGVQTLVPPATFDPRLPQNSQKNDAHFKVSVMINFVRGH